MHIVVLLLLKKLCLFLFVSQVFETEHEPLDLSAISETPDTGFVFGETLGKDSLIKHQETSQPLGNVDRKPFKKPQTIDRNPAKQDFNQPGNINPDPSSGHYSQIRVIQKIIENSPNSRLNPSGNDFGNVSQIPQTKLKKTTTKSIISARGNRFKSDVFTVKKSSINFNSNHLSTIKKNIITFSPVNLDSLEAGTVPTKPSFNSLEMDISSRSKTDMNSRSKMDINSHSKTDMKRVKTDMNSRSKTDMNLAGRVNFNSLGTGMGGSAVKGISDSVKSQKFATEPAPQTAVVESIVVLPCR